MTNNQNKGIEKRQSRDVKQFISSLLSQAKQEAYEEVREFIKTMPTHPAGYANERMIKPSNLLQFLESKNK